MTKTESFKRLAIVLALTVAAVAVIGTAKKHTPAAATARSSCGDASMAYVMSQHFVEARLKAPATAEFPWFDDVTVTTYGGGCSFKVAAYVDAQNGFGALIRIRYLADLTVKGDLWLPNDITLLE